MHSSWYIRRFCPTCILAFCLCCVVSGCAANNTSKSITATSTTNFTATATPSPIATTSPTSIPPTPTPIVTIVPATPGIAPTVILSPTPVPGGSIHSQQVVFKDRALIINDASRGAGTDASSISIRLTITLKNTSTNAIKNAVSYYSLFGSEGDVFGLPPNTNNPLFGPIAASSSRSGTIAFQVPLGADKTLRLLYRPEIASETVFVPINV